MRFFLLTISLLLSGGLYSQTLNISCPESMEWLIPRMEELIREAGFSPSIKAYPPERSLMLVRLGSVAGEFMRTDEALAEIPELVKVDIPLYFQKIVVVTLRKDIDFKGFQDLQHLRVGYVRTNRFIGELVESLPDHVEAPHQDSFFRMLKEGRFDVGIVLLYTAEHQKSEEDFSQLRILSPVLSLVPVYFVLHKSHEDLIPRLEAAFEKKLATGWTLVPPF